MLHELSTKLTTISLVQKFSGWLKIYNKLVKVITICIFFKILHDLYIFNTILLINYKLKVSCIYKNKDKEEPKDKAFSDLTKFYNETRC